MVAIAHQVALRARPPFGGVERETGNYVLGHVRGQPAFLGQQAQPVERRIGGRLALERAAGQHANRLQAVLRMLELLGVDMLVFGQRMSGVLRIGDVVAAAAPGVEQPAPLARAPVEQAAGGGEGVRSLADRRLRACDQRRALAPTARAHGCAADKSRRGKGARVAQRSSAVIAKIGVCGRWLAINSNNSLNVSAAIRMF